MANIDEMVKVSRQELASVALLTLLVVTLLAANMAKVGDRIAALINPPSHLRALTTIDLICPAAVTEGSLRVGCSGSALAPGINVTGFVDGASATESGLHIVGWSVDLANKSPVALVAVTVSGIARVAGQPTINRPDVAATIGMPTALRAGFDLTVPTDGHFQPADLSIRVFGITNDGRVRELESATPLFKHE